MIDLHREFTDWLGYEFPAEKLTSFQDDVLKAILVGKEKRVPLNSKELAQRLKDLLPKPRK